MKMKYDIKNLKKQIINNEYEDESSYEYEYEYSSESESESEDESLEKYLEEIGKIPLLSQKKELELAKLARKELSEGSAGTALEQLIKSNLRFVVSVAKQYQNQGLSLSDLINEGNLGLIKGISRFDEKKGFKCISYCVWWIRQAILQAIADQARCIRCPTNKLAFYNKVVKTYSKLEQKLKMQPTVNDIVVYLNSSEKEVEEALKNSIQPTSLDAPILEGEDTNLYDVLKSETSPEPDFKLEKESFFKDIKILLETLSEKESQVISLHYGFGCKPMTLEKVAFLLKLTRERCRQIEINGIKRLRISYRKKLLRPYLCK
ncbi:sigma-70 family RNA polymerase sigma factor [Candidatus Karelsulcia muelleri]|uniref:sigma-70 family RNA polymerase sigma factor n=1 Tax=Candidatus Karelsulcia muelleri TaxID=336810 RepID=UPI001EF5DFBD|nr:RNA polymerase sigma factor RpoD/SigA [Candidatus Karelsulcia muelleri]